MFSAKDLFFTRTSGGYIVNNSLRFRSSASAYLSRTFGTPTNNKIFTWSAWVKIGAVPAAREGLFVASNGSTYFGFEFTASAALNLYDSNVGGANIAFTTTQVFRDPSSWYHIVLAVDTTQATAANRNKLYINGVQVTSFATAVYSPLNSSPSMNGAVSHAFGTWTPAGSGLFFDGYFAESYFIDGQQLTPSSFGENDATTGVWKPKAYTGTYGTNGFYLKFSDATSATTLSYDYSGNGNNWTPTNISVAAGVTYDSMIDSPTNYADGGNGRGNYAVLNPLMSAATLEEANLKLTATAASWVNAAGTIFVNSGKWYWEGTVVSAPYVMIGVATNAASTTANYATATNTWTYLSDGTKYGNGSTATAYGASFTTNDVIGIALDMDGGTLTFYKNNVSQGTAFSTGLSGLSVAPWVGAYNSGCGFYINFGQRPFTYTPPSGFKALNTQNLPTPTISNGANYMAATVFSAAGSSQAVSNAVNNVSFQTDFLWLKDRTSAGNHYLADVIRGPANLLYSNATAAEGSAPSFITAFNSDGFQINTNGVYTNSNSIVGWQWKESVSAGFDIVAFTRDASATQNVSHNLGVTPAMVIIKARSTTSSWNVWHQSMDAAPNNYYMLLESTAAKAASTAWCVPSSSTVGVTNFSNGVTAVIYCFAAVSGYSAFGSYTGNGSADGPFVFTGFRPRYVIIKCTNAAGTGWYIYDTARNTYNALDLYLRPEVSDAEGTLATMDTLSNGFKLRSSNSQFNGSGNTYLYAAFCENPFKYSLAR